MIAVTVAPGDTLSQIASQHGVSLASVEAANPSITNPNMIFAGESVAIPSGSYSSWTPKPVQTQPVYTPPVQHSYNSPSQVASVPQASSSGNLADVPGVPHAFAACVAFRESTNGTNQAFDGGAYGIIRASGVNVNGQSIAAQKAAFSNLYAQYGSSPWSPSDGC